MGIHSDHRIIKCQGWKGTSNALVQSLHFTGEESDSEGLSDLAKVTLVMSGELGSEPRAPNYPSNTFLPHHADSLYLC